MDNPNSHPDRRFWGQSRPPAPTGTGPEGPVTDLGDAGPGFYQTRGTGNKTGRQSPRPQLRASARDLTLAKHGLIDQGAADPNQGQLFNADKVVGPRRSDAQIIRDTGVNMPTHISHEKSLKRGTVVNEMEFGAARGYLPNLSTKQKVNALKSVQEGRTQSGTDRGGGATAEMMQDREAARSRAGDQPWYTGVDSSGQNSARIQGEAAAQLENRATRSGVTQAAMTRAAAVTSPQSAWDKGVPGSPDHRFPNLNHAEGVVQATEVSRGYVDRSEAMEIGSQIDVSDGGLGTMGAKAAGEHFDKGDDVTTPFPVKSAQSQKAPNFQASLHLSGHTPAEQRMAATSFTVDRHDARAAGIGGSKVLEDRQGVYDVAAMTGTRVAHKNRTLPPNEQAREWVGVRGANQPETSDNTLFDSGTTAGRIVANPRVFPPNTSRARRRGSSVAEDLGLEF